MAAVTEGPRSGSMWVRRKLEPARKKVDRGPKRFGPEGTWVGEPEGEETDRTQTPVRERSTVAALQRQDTLTD